MTSTSPRTRCRVQRGKHPALRYGVQKSASCGYCLCRYLWIPHQVRNDGTAGSSKGVTPHSDAGSIVGYSWIPRRAPGHPAQRCGVQRGKARHLFARIPGYRVVHRVTPHSDAGSSEEPQRTSAAAGISGYRVKHRVTPHYDAGSRKVPLVGIAFADIPGFRIKCGMTGRVFLDTASQRGMTWSTASSAV